MSRTRLTPRRKLIRRLRKDYGPIALIGLIIVSAFLSGHFYGLHGADAKVNVKSGVKMKSNTTKLAPANDQHSRIINGYMSSMIGSCYYDTYQQNETHLAGTGNLCDNSMLFLKELCKTKNYDTCHSEFLRKYLAGMGE